MSLYRNKYRIETARLDVWDYSKYGYYFVTICTHNRSCFFGSSDNEKILLNELGKKAEENWLEIPSHFENVELDEFIVMPNHLHGIIFIRRDHTRRDSINRVSTIPPFIKKNPMFYDLSLGKIIRWFKGRTTHEIRFKLNFEKFSWQRRYYDHIIRNEKELLQIQEYISLNPLNWLNDDENPHIDKKSNIKENNVLPSAETTLIP